RDLRLKAVHELHELGRGARMQPALVDDGEAAGNRLRSGGGRSGAVVHFPCRTRLATLMYLRPAVCASSSALSRSSLTRTLESLISMGRLTPAMTSIRPGSMTEMARLEGV